MREAGTHAGMRQSGDDSELVAVILENVKVGRERVVFTGLRRKEIVGMQSERCTDADHATRRLLVARRDLGVISENVEPRERKRDARGADKSATADVHGCILVTNDHVIV